MGGSWTFFLLLAVAATPVWPLEYNITTTWNGGEIDHPPIQVTLAGSIDTQYLELSIDAPFFNDTPVPPGPSGQPFFGLYTFEVVETYFLNDDDQYLQVQISPWGQYNVLFMNGMRNDIRHSLLMEVTTTRSNDTWTSLARIPVEYLPKNVTRFNAFGMHGSGENRIYESLYPASENASEPNFHALEYFNDIDLSGILPEQESADMSEIWVDSLQGIFRYRIQTTWNDVPISHPPAEITLQGFTGGVEMNVTAPFFNDPAPDGKAGKPFYGLWDYEVVEMFFLNDNDEYLEVELGPWGQHLLLILKGPRNVLKHSLALDYIIVERTDPTGGELGQWKGSAMLPPGYFPPNVTRMNAYAIHGTDKAREYQSLYPAPNNDPDFPVPDFHRLELFQPIDFKYQVTDNTEYSELWQDDEGSGSAAVTSAVETEEVVEVVTVLGPADVLLQPTSAPVQPLALHVTQETVVLDNEEVLLRIPKPQLVLPDEQREQRLEEEVGVIKPSTFGVNTIPKPQPVRIGHREFGTPQATNQQGRPLQHSESFTDDNLQSQDQRRPLTHPQRGTLEFHNQGQPHPQFQDERRAPGNSQFQNQSPHNQGQLQGPPPVHGEDLPQETSEFSPFQSQALPQEQTFITSHLQGQRQPAVPIEEHAQDQFNNQNVRQPQRPSLFQTQEDPQFPNHGQPQFQNQGQPQFQSQGQPQFQSHGQPQFQNQGPPQFQNQGQPQFQNQGPPRFQNRGPPQVQSQGQPQFQNQGRPQFQNQGRPQSQNQGHPQSQNQGRPQFQNQGQTQFQEETQPQFQRPNDVVLPVQGPPRFQEHGRPPIQFQESSQFEDPGLPTQAPHFQIPNQGFQQGSPSVDISGSETSVGNPSLDVGIQENITPEVEQAVITLAEGTPALPPPHPVCFELGLVPDPDRCYVFHECVLEAGEWQMYSWRCRRGQVFDPRNVACVRGRCARTPTRRRRVRRS